jgi:hypothetical protein
LALNVEKRIPDTSRKAGIERPFLRFRRTEATSVHRREPDILSTAYQE